MGPERSGGRAADRIRPIRFQRGFVGAPAGSCLVSMGRTTVLCTVSVVPGVPAWMAGKGLGWVTAEYSMLPGSTVQRKPREVSRGKPEGRTQEIQRLVGRSLRSVIDMRNLGENTLWADCDVLEADGGTRTAGVNGAYIALYDALRWMEKRQMLFKWPLLGTVSAISVGWIDDAPRVDLDYVEDSGAQVDMNVVAASDDRLIEVQGTGEKRPFSQEEFDQLLSLARSGIRQVRQAQEAALKEGS